MVTIPTRTTAEMFELSVAFSQGKIFTGLHVLFVEAAYHKVEPAQLLREIFLGLNAMEPAEWQEMLAVKAVPFEWVRESKFTRYGLPVFATHQFLSWDDAMLLRHTGAEIYQTSHG